MGTCGFAEGIFKDDNTYNNKVIFRLSENSSRPWSRRLLAGSSETSRNEMTKNLIPTISMLCWKNCCIWNYQQTQETVLVTLLSTFSPQTMEAMRNDELPR